MLDAVLAVGADLVVLGFARHRNQVLVHLLGAVGVSGGLLYCGAATEIEVAAGQCGGATGDGGAFQDQHAGTVGGRGHRRAPAPDTETDHDDVDIIGPFGHGRGVDGIRDIKSAHSGEDIAAATPWLERVLV